MLKECIKEAKEQEYIIKRISLSEEELHGKDMTRLEFDEVCFLRCKFSECGFTKTNFINCVFEECDFSNCVFTDSYFKKSKFTNCKGTGANFTKSVFKECVISDTLLDLRQFFRVLLGKLQGRKHLF